MNGFVVFERVDLNLPERWAIWLHRWHELLATWPGAADMLAAIGNEVSACVTRLLFEITQPNETEDWGLWSVELRKAKRRQSQQLTRGLRRCLKLLDTIRNDALSDIVYEQISRENLAELADRAAQLQLTYSEVLRRPKNTTNLSIGTPRLLVLVTYLELRMGSPQFRAIAELLPVASAAHEQPEEVMSEDAVRKRLERYRSHIGAEAYRRDQEQVRSLITSGELESALLQQYPNF